MKLSEFQRRIAEIEESARLGCSDSGCRINKQPRGMSTNGGCTCDARGFADRLEWLLTDLRKARRFERDG